MFKRLTCLLVLLSFIAVCLPAEAAAAKKKTTNKKPGFTCSVKLGKIGSIRLKL